jgi:PEGA domain
LAERPTIRKNIMDAAVAGITVTSPQPTQLTFEDGLGERRYAVGTVSEPLEVLKLSSVLSSVSSFDFALRERAARLAGFRHESYGRVRSIELDRRTSALLVTSDYVAGVRLSTLLADTQKRGIPPEFNAVRTLVRQLVSAAAALHGSAPDVGNGAIAPERLVLTPAGRLTVVEYVLGAALEQLGHTRARYWRELAVALPGAVGTPIFDARTDVTQVGAVALALIIGRPLTPEDYPERLIDLIQTATMRTVAGVAEPLPESVRDWLTQALQLDQWESFASPTEARAGLEEAFGVENPIVELGALQVYLSRYAATDAVVEPDLGPRLEAMKAFLARYPSRKTAATPTPEKSEERVEAPSSPAPSLMGPDTLRAGVSAADAVRPGVSAADAVRPGVSAADPVPADVPVEPVAAVATEPVPEPAAVSEPAHPADVAPSALIVPDVNVAQPDLIGAIPTYAEERRGATPVVLSRRKRLLAAAAGVVLLIGAIAAFWWFRGAGSPANGTLSVGTSPAGIAVFVDGQPHGVTPLAVELPPGEHIIELRTETERRRIPITLTAGGQVSQYFEFAPAGATIPTGELLVRTEPIGAAVTVDGKFVGRSPVSVSDLTPGTHTVLMQNDVGTQTERVIIENGRTASLVVSLGAVANKASTAGWIRLDAPAEIQVLEDGRVIGSTDLERVMLPVGRHDLEFVNTPLGYRERRTVQVTAGQTTTLRPQWPNGSMAINAIPWAEVLVDNKRVGETPIGNITVPIGAHEVLFRHPELGERRMSVTVSVGEPLKVGVDLRSK